MPLIVSRKVFPVYDQIFHQGRLSGEQQQYIFVAFGAVDAAAVSVYDNGIIESQKLICIDVGCELDGSCLLSDRRFQLLDAACLYRLRSEYTYRCRCRKGHGDHCDQ